MEIIIGIIICFTEDWISTRETGCLLSVILKGKATTSLFGSFVPITKDLVSGNLKVIFSPSEVLQI